MSMPVLDIENLSVEFPVYGGSVKAINSISLTVNQGEIVGIVGESGSGKSVTSMMVMKLIPDGAYRLSGGSISLLGNDIFSTTEDQMRTIRGGDVSMIFQEPMTALNPTKKIGKQMVEVIKLHQKISRNEAESIAVKLLGEMHVSDPISVMQRFPFELSGGMRQRVLIAMAFSCNPKLIIADEPTTALDVTVQKQVLCLLKEKSKNSKTSILFITHDMAVVSQFCDRVYVMYAGSLVESGDTKHVLNNPRHPYTKGLMAALPELAIPKSELQSIPGNVPDLRTMPSGCVFSARCTLRVEKCSQKPHLQSTDDDSQHKVSCWNPIY